MGRCKKNSVPVSVLSVAMAIRFRRRSLWRQCGKCCLARGSILSSCGLLELLRASNGADGEVPHLHEVERVKKKTNVREVADGLPLFHSAQTCDRHHDFFPSAVQWAELLDEAFRSTSVNVLRNLLVDSAERRAEAAEPASASPGQLWRLELKRRFNQCRTDGPRSQPGQDLRRRVSTCSTSQY